MEFKDKVVIVSGGADGMGRACSTQLAAEGARLFILDVKRGYEAISLLASRRERRVLRRLSILMNNVSPGLPRVRPQDEAVPGRRRGAPEARRTRL